MVWVNGVVFPVGFFEIHSGKLEHRNGNAPFPIGNASTLHMDTHGGLFIAMLVYRWVYREQFPIYNHSSYYGALRLGIPEQIYMLKCFP